MIWASLVLAFPAKKVQKGKKVKVEVRERGAFQVDKVKREKQVSNKNMFFLNN